MKFTIISIDERRAPYKEVIRKFAGMEEVHMKAVDGRQEDVKEQMMSRGLWVNNWSPSRGEAGVWMSNYDRWLYTSTLDEPLVVFEDDAIIRGDFKDRVDAVLSVLPEDWDYCTLWVPENQKIDYYYDVIFNSVGDPMPVGPNRNNETSLFRYNNSDIVSLVYQGYGMVSLMYSPKGGQKLASLAQRTGIYTPVDCWIYQQAHMGRLRGFAPHPQNAEIVQYDWLAETTVHNSERLI